MTLIIIIHIIACIVLITLVLIQRGRGSGLVESFQGVESMFGTKTNEFLTRTTTILSIVFFMTCLSLAVLSVRQSRSLMRNIKVETPAVSVLPTAEQAKETVQVSSPEQKAKEQEAQIPEPKEQPLNAPIQSTSSQPPAQEATKAE